MRKIYRDLLSETPGSDASTLRTLWMLSCLREWRKLLKPGGFIAVAEISWLKPPEAARIESLRKEYLNWPEAQAVLDLEYYEKSA